MQQHAASFIAHTEVSTGAELCRFIKDDYNAFLECGILAHAFLRPRPVTRPKRIFEVPMRPHESTVPALRVQFIAAMRAISPGHQ